MASTNYEYANKFCRRCNKFLGNYMTGDYYKLIRLKYCDDCRPVVQNEQKRYSKKNLHKARKPLCEALLERAIITEEENKLLRQKNKILAAEVERLYG